MSECCDIEKMSDNSGGGSGPCCELVSGGDRAVVASDTEIPLTNADDKSVVQIDASAGVGAGLTVLLPDSSTVPLGFTVTVAKTDAGVNALSFTTQGGDVVDVNVSLDQQFEKVTYAMVDHATGQWKAVWNFDPSSSAPLAQGAFAIAPQANQNANFNISAVIPGSIYGVDISGGNVIATLPQASTVIDSYKTTVYVTTLGNTLTVAPFAGDAIIGPTTVTQVGASLTLVRIAATTWLSVVHVLGATVATQRDALGAAAGIWPVSAGGTSAGDVPTARAVLRTPYSAASFSTGVVAPGLTSGGGAYFFDTTLGAGTFNLPAAASVANGHETFCIVNDTGANNVTINAAAGDTVDGAASLTLLPGQGCTLQLAVVTAAAGEWEIVSNIGSFGGIGGSTGATDNALLAADGVAGATLQNRKFSIGDAGGENFFDNTGGNARGAEAVDFQTIRAAATDVASGSRSGILNGRNNRAAGTDSATVGTDNADVTASRAVALGGVDASVTGADAAVIGGDGNAAQNQKAIATGWDGLADHYGEQANGHQMFAALGDAQSGYLLFSGPTADATPTELSLMNTGNYLTLNDGDSYLIEVQAIALATGGNDAAWREADINGIIRRTGGTTSWTGTGATVAPGVDNAGTLTGALLGISADDGNDRMALIAVGIAATAIRWVVRVKYTKVNLV